MFSNYNIKKPIGSDLNVDFDDTLLTKKALRQLGYYEPQAANLTKFPDEPLFNGIKRFQADHGLRVDGVVKPGGETEATLNLALLRAAPVRDHRKIDRQGLFGMFDRLNAPDRSSDCPLGVPETQSGPCRATGTCD